MQTANSTIYKKNFGQKALQKNWAKVYLIYFCGTSEQSSGPQNPFAKILLLSIKLLWISIEILSFSIIFFFFDQNPFIFN